MNKSDAYVQIKNPKTKRYVIINRIKGLIIAYKNTPGPYKKIPIVHYVHDPKPNKE